MKQPLLKTIITIIVISSIGYVTKLCYIPDTANMPGTYGPIILMLVSVAIWLILMWCSDLRRLL